MLYLKEMNLEDAKVQWEFFQTCPDENGVENLYMNMSFEDFCKNIFLEDKENTVIYTPEHEIPVCTVPETCESPDAEKIEDNTRSASSVSAQRYVKIIAKPRT